MKITTYKQDGTFLSEKSVGIEVPDYLKHFDDTYPIFNVTEDEYNLISSEAESFSKSLLLDKLSIIINFDYNQYLKSVCSQNEEESINTSNILKGESFDEIFENLIDEVILPLLPNNESFIVKLIPEYSEYDIKMPWDEIRKTLKVSFFRQKDEISSIKNKCALIRRNHFLPYVICKLCQNALQIFDYFGHRFKRMYPNRLYPLGILNNIKVPFEILSEIELCDDFPEEHYISFKSLPVRLIQNIVKDKGICRSRYYHLIHLVDRLYTTKAATSNFIRYISSSYQPMANNQYDFKLYNTVKGVYKDLTLTNEQISGILSNPQELNIIRSVLSEIAQDYSHAKGCQWKLYIDKKYEDFRYRKQGTNVGWAEYEYEYNSEKQKLNTDPKYHLQESYEELVAIANTMGPEKDVEFTDYLISGLLTIFRTNYYNKVKDDNQDGLYETMYKFNYIKSKIRETSQIKKSYDSPLQKAKEYIEPLFDNEDFVLPYNKESVEQLFYKILTSDMLQCLDIVKPNGFKGGFNLTLIYNVIGYLKSHTIHILQGDGKNIDIYLGKKYCEKTGIRFTERKHYINDYNDDKYYFRQNKDLIDAIIEEHLKSPK